MCTFHGSFSQQKLVELVDKNRDLGQYSHSIAAIDIKNKLVHIERHFGPAEIEDNVFPPECYYIVHQQMPSANLTYGDIDPAQNNDSVLWMDGKFSINTTKNLQGLFHLWTNWPSRLMLSYLLMHRTPKKLAGDFACLFLDCEELYLFRNETSELYYNYDMTISTKPFNGARQVPANVVNGFNPFQRKIFPLNGLEFVTLGNEWAK